MLRLRDSVRRTDRSLVHVMERFPAHWGQIRRLADSDKKFSDLCRDYADAVELCRYWQEQGEPGALERAQDYTTMATELEAEILREIIASGHLTTER